MHYNVIIDEIALKQLKKLDKNTSKKIWNFIENNLDKCENPRLYGKALTGNHKGKWRYRSWRL